MTTTASNTAEIAAEIRTLEARRLEAMTAADIETLDALLDEQALYTHSTATTDTKSEYLARVADGTFNYGPIDYTELQMIVRDDAVLVIGEMRATAIVSGATRAIHNRGLSVWLRRDGRWRLAAFQPTTVPPVG